MNAVAASSLENIERKGWLSRLKTEGLCPATLALSLIVLLSLGLHLYNLDAIGDANVYYTAAVKSMLQSWHNFFFVAAEPGASVTVDKPPLGLWMQALSAMLFGVSGVSVILPNILAGVLSVPLVYYLVKKYFGTSAGLVAALALALTPISIAVDRNNTVDGMLIFTLLLATWAFLSATETGKLRTLLLGGLLVGLGFNIKMMQAFLPVPAFYALYFLGTETGWGRKLLHLGLTSVVLVVVALSWAVAVDLTPADQRPYVGSSTNNSVLELIFDHNGIDRLLGRNSGQSSSAAAFPGRSDGQADGTTDSQVTDSAGSQDRPGTASTESAAAVSGDTDAQAGETASAQPTAESTDSQADSGSGRNRPGNPPAGGTARPGPGSGPTAQGGSGGGNGMTGETGQAGYLRLFQTPLAKEMSWLLPFGLFSLVLLVASGKLSLPLSSAAHKGAILWGGWLVTCLVFFSAASYFHTYYLAMLAPPLAALVGSGFSVLGSLRERNAARASLLLLCAAGATLAFELYLVKAYSATAAWLPILVIVFGLAAVGGILVTFARASHAAASRLISVAALVTMLVIPAWWSYQTVLTTDANAKVPSAYDGSDSGSSRRQGNTGSTSIESTLLSFLETHTQDTEYLVAVSSAQSSGSKLVLETGRPVLFMGGYSGSDDVTDADDLAALVAEGKLRYILSSGRNQRGGSGVTAWVSEHCSLVTEVQSSGSQGGNSGSTLYQCGG